MYFLFASAAFAALVISFQLLVARSRKHPEMFAGDWKAMLTSIFYTGGFAGTFGAMLAAASSVAPSVVAGMAVAVATAAVIVLVASFLRRRRRLTLPGSPMPG